MWHPVDSDKRDKWSKYVYPHVNTEIGGQEMLQKLCPTYETGLAPDAPRMKKSKNQGGTVKSTYCDYLNKLSKVPAFQNKEYTIEFRPAGKKVLQLHPTRTLCRPDIVAVRRYPGYKSIDSEQLYWSHLEATGEEESEGASVENGEAQTGAYIAYHLQVRPDLVSVPGIFVNETGFKLFFSNACRIYHTPRYKWNGAKLARKLLYAWMWRLYHPECDPSITVDTKTSPPTFTVTTAKNTKHDQLVVFRAGESIGRRTIVLRSFESDSSIVVKEQYIENTRRFREGPILEKIHKGGRFPGVVRLDDYEYVRNDNQNISVSFLAVTRQKTRVVMKDKGNRLVDVKTPRELLMGIYDLLEISRSLFSKSNILHRDISPDNVLFTEAPAIPTDPLRHDVSDMCFSEYLLEGPAGQDYSDAESDRRRRLTTNVMVIDFDSSEDRDPAEGSPGGPTARTGTPIFMARMVRSNKYPTGLYELPPMPDVAPELRERYQRTLNTRLNTFPANEEMVIKIPEETTMAFNEFQHLPRYDAESVFWCLLWSCMQAQPAEKLPEEKIPDTDWSTLTGAADARDDRFIRTANFPNGCLHSSYAELVPLLNDMRKHLQGDLKYAKEKEGRGGPEYIHEAFQRLILNFLVANKNKLFMNLKKSDRPRSAMDNPMARSGTQLTKKTWDQVVGEIKTNAHKKRKVSEV